jgi:hypothetical protein
MRCVVTLCLVGALALATGCSWFQLPFSRDARGLNRGVTIDSLQQELAYYASNFGGTIGAAAEDISDASSDRRVKRNALLWRLRMVPAIQRTAYTQDPRAGYVRVLFVAIAQRRYLETGDGKDLFKDQQHIAIDAARRLEADALALGEQFLTQAELRRVVTEEQQLAEAHPIVGREFSLQRASIANKEIQQSDVFTSVLSIPLTPFRALEGVDSGAQAIREFNVTARRFTGIAAALPEQLRGELELFLYDVEDRQTVAGGLEALQKLGESADRVTVVAETLPDELRTTLSDAQATVDRASEAVKQLQELAPAIDSAAEKLRDGSMAWREVIGSRAEREADDNGDGRPFDIKDWESTALAIGGAAGELRGLASDAETLAASPALDAAVDRALGRAIDQAFWRAAALIGLFFALLLVYRVVSALLPSRAPG